MSSLRLVRAYIVHATCVMQTIELARTRSHTNITHFRNVYAVWLRYLLSPEKLVGVAEWATHRGQMHRTHTQSTVTVATEASSPAFSRRNSECNKTQTRSSGFSPLSISLSLSFCFETGTTHEERNETKEAHLTIRMLHRCTRCVLCEYKFPGHNPSHKPTICKHLNSIIRHKWQLINWFTDAPQLATAAVTAAVSAVDRMESEE